MAPNKVQVDIGHQHSCTFFHLVRRVFLTCAESEGKTNEQSLRVACVSNGMEKNTNTKLIITETFILILLSILDGMQIPCSTVNFP